MKDLENIETIFSNSEMLVSVCPKSIGTFVRFIQKLLFRSRNSFEDMEE